MHPTRPDADPTSSAAARVLVEWARIDSDLRRAELLDDTERGRLAHLRQEADQLRFITSRAALKDLVAAAAGVATSDVRLDYACFRCGRQHGRPVVVAPPRATPWQASLSHTGEWVLVAVSDAGPVGVDVEQVGGTSFAGFGQVALSASERLGLQRLPAQDRAAAGAAIWARKEAVLKATGHGLSVEPSGVEAGLLPAGTVWLDGHAVQFRDVPASAGYVAAVAVQADTSDALAHLP